MNYQLEISKYRQFRKMTQEELAHKSGLTQSFISALENDRKSPTLRVIMKIATALDVCPHKLVKYSCNCSKCCVNS